MSVAHSSLLTYNAALNRPAYQKSELNNAYGGYVASLANDGSRQTTSNSGPKVPGCAISNIETNPWWAVDLGRPTTVYIVHFTNVNDGPGGKPM